MDNGGEKSQNVKASTSASTNKRVSFTPLIKVVNSDHGSGRIPDLDTNLKGIEHGSDNASESSDSDSSSDDDTHVTPQLLTQPGDQNYVPQSNADTELSRENDKVDVMGEVSSPSQNSEIVREAIDDLPMLSPPIQVMERCRRGSDPDSLPDSALSRSSTPKAPLGWSTTSNDSLFSIRIGNNSFSKGPASRTDVNLSKSEDLHKSGDLFVSGELFQFGNYGELPKSKEPYHSGELHKAMESFKVSDVTIRGKLVSCSQASSVSKGEELMDPGETGMEYVLLNHTPGAQVETSSKTFSASTPTCGSVEGGTKAQTTTHPKKEKSSCHPLCYPGFCKISCKCCCAWPICSGNCFGLKGHGSYRKSSVLSWKWFTCPSCSRNCCYHGGSWSCKCCSSGCPSLKCAWKCC